MREIITTKCPHCDKNVYTFFVYSPPTVTETMTEKMVKDTKKDLKKRIEQIQAPEDIKKQLLSEIDNEEVIISKQDVEEILKTFIASLGDIKKEVSIIK